MKSQREDFSGCSMYFGGEVHIVFDDNVDHITRVFDQGSASLAEPKPPNDQGDGGEADKIDEECFHTLYLGRLMLRSRFAFSTTVSDEAAMAPAAIIGLSRIPYHG